MLKSKERDVEGLRVIPGLSASAGEDDVIFGAVELANYFAVTELPRQSDTAAKKPYDLELGRAANELQKEVEEATRLAVQMVSRRHPELIKKLGIHAPVNVYVKRPAGSSVVFDAIVDCIFTMEGALLPQVGIRAAVAARYPQYSVPKDWNKRLPRWAIEKIKGRIACSGTPFNKMRVKHGFTLNDLKLAAQGAVQVHREGAQIFTPKVAVNSECLIINNKPFSIQVNKSGGREYKMVRINLDVLINALSR